jgi:hypothetical protein
MLKNGQLNLLELSLVKRDLFVFSNGVLKGFKHLIESYVKESQVYVNNKLYFAFNIRFRNKSKVFLCKEEIDCKSLVKKLKGAIGQKNVMIIIGLIVL